MRKRLLIPLIVAVFSGAALPAQTRAADTDKAAAMGALKLAKHYYDQGEFKKAAERFREAYAIDANPAFLFNAARAEQRGFMLDEAERDFNAVLAASKDDKMRHRAQVHLQEIKAYRAQLSAHGGDAAKAKADVERAQKDAERAKQDAAKARAEAQKARDQAAAAKAQQQAKGAQQVVAGMAGMSLKQKVLFGSAAGLVVLSAVVYGVAISTRSSAVDMEKQIAGESDAATRESLIADRAVKVETSTSQRNASILALGIGVGLGWYAYAHGAPVARKEPGKTALSWAPWVDGRGVVVAARF